jgi:hypothetical protein
VLSQSKNLDDFIGEADVRIVFNSKTGFFVVYHYSMGATFKSQSLASERPDLAVDWALIGSLEVT